MHKFGLRGKVALFIILYAFTALALVSILLYQNLQTREAANYQQRMHLRFGWWKLHVEHHVSLDRPLAEILKEPIALKDTANRYRMFSHESVAVYAIEPATVMNKSVKLERMEQIKGSEMPQFLQLKEVSEQLVLGKDGIMFLAPIGSDGEHFFLGCYFPHPNAGTALQSLYGLLAQVAGVLIIVALLLGIAANYTLVRPILTLTTAVKDVAEGDLDQSIQISTGDELETLSSSFNDMVGRLREMQEMAIDASPLTGLPGNNSIAARIEEAIDACEEVTIIYVDIDNFKAYNDVYGFEAGDRGILFTAETLESTMSRAAGLEGFLGHVGGDDFVVVLPDPLVDDFATRACQGYDKGIQEFYRADDIQRGGIRTKDRQGQERDFPFMSISLAGVPLSSRQFGHFGEVSSVAAEVKKAAKAKPGSAFVLDRRAGEGGNALRET